MKDLLFFEDRKEMNKVMWFNDVGIVLVELEHPPYRKYYIKHVPGFDEETDIQEIRDWGSHFPRDVGDVLFGFVILDNKDETQITQ